MRRAAACLAFACIAALRLSAIQSVSYTGSFAADDDKRDFFFTLSAAGSVTLRTFSYAGGVNVAGTTIPAGGFDPTISVFDSAGNLIAYNRDGGCGNVPADPTTSFCWDSLLQLSLPPGTYRAVLTQSENLPVGPTLAGSFVYDPSLCVPALVCPTDAQGNFTPAPGNATPGFWDSFPNKRTASYAIDILGATSSEGTTITSLNTLPSGITGHPYQFTFTAQSGPGVNLQWSAAPGSPLPPGLTLTAGGTLSGTPAAGFFTFTVQVFDGAQTVAQPVTLAIAGSLQITSSGALGEFVPSSSVASTPAATGGTPPYFWSATGLPGGFNFNPTTGAFSGEASGPGPHSFSLQVSDSESPPVNTAISVVYSVLGITSSGGGAATTTNAYSQTFGGIGGTGSYSFTGFGIPSGLTLSSGGLLSGTPKNAGAYGFTIQITDSNGFTTSSNFNIAVSGPASPKVIVPGGSLPDGTVSTAYSTSLTATGGSEPYTWSLIGGALPDGGFSLSSAGGITGTPKTPATYTFTALATDSVGVSSYGTFTIKIAPAPLVLSSITTFPGGIVNSEYPLQILTAGGGVGPYTFTVTGALPGGLSFSSPQISGTPTAAGTFNFTITVTDSTGAKVAIPASIAISPPAANLVISQSTVPFTLTVGSDGVPTPASVTVHSSDVTQILNYSVTATPAVSWLDLTSSTTTPGSVGLTLDPSALSLAPSATPYQTTIDVTCVAPSPCAGKTQTISVSLTVSAPAPQLTLTSNLLSFTAYSSNPGTSSQSLGIQNTGGGTLTINSIVPANNWITVTGAPSTLAAGPAANMTVTVNPTGLINGFYLSSITVNSSAGNASVPVSFNLIQNATITLAPAGAQFQARAGNAPGNTAGSFAVSVSGGSSVSWGASVLPGASWLSVSTPSGVATPSSAGAVNFAIDPAIAAGLAPNTYYGTIQVTSSDVVDSPLGFEVVLNVGASTSPIEPSTSAGGLVFSSGIPLTTGKLKPSDVSPATSQTIQVFASSTNTVQYQASASTSDGGTWLTVSPATGLASAGTPGQSVVTANPAGLLPGVYLGSVSYAFSAAQVSTVNITLVVAPGGTSGGNLCTPSKLVPTQVGLISNFAANAGWPTPLAVSVLNDCGSAVTSGQVVATFSNGDPPLLLTPADSTSGTFIGTWTPRSISSQVSVTAQASAPGFPSASALITGEVTKNTVPVLALHGTLNVYNSQIGGGISPGAIVAVYGSNLSSQVTPSSSTPLTTSLGGSQVIIGGIPVPLYYVSPGQINAQIPFGLTAGNTYQLLVVANGAVSTPQPIQLVPVSSGIATYPTGQIIAQHAVDYSLVTETSPAIPGEYITFYLAGLGATNTPVDAGAATPTGTLINPLVTPTLTLNNNPVTVAFVGLTPTAVGLYQINFQVPAGTPAGDQELTISQSGLPSNLTILPVGQAPASK